MNFVIFGEGNSDVVGTKDNDENVVRQGSMRILLDVLAKKPLTINPELFTKNTMEYQLFKKRLPRSMMLRAPKNEKIKKSDVFINVKYWVQYVKTKQFSTLYGLVWYQDCDDNKHAEIYEAVQAGFKFEQVADYGVPMLPKPCLEAWLLAYFQEDDRTAPYTDCAQFEKLDGWSKNAPRSPKNILARRLNCPQGAIWKKMKIGPHSGYEVVRGIDWDKVDMPSFNQFKTDFLAVVNKLSETAETRSVLP